ncbi:ZIP zinc transporter-domain-containing protein [Cunninghamella echinulata]|nr:ZIP zinc transporter-domain-containing protein [Cunninghamella echinulata]
MNGGNNNNNNGQQQPDPNLNGGGSINGNNTIIPPGLDQNNITNPLDQLNSTTNPNNITSQYPFGQNNNNEQDGPNAHLSQLFGFNSQNCTLEEAQQDDYNLNLRIATVFIILVASTFGVFIPFLVHRLRAYEDNSFRDQVLTVAKFFGIGVILSTAFAHMLPESSDKFNSPCLGGGWNSHYHSFTAVFCLIATFIIQGIEVIALARLQHLRSERKKSSSIQHHSRVEEVNESGIRVAKEETDMLDHEIGHMDNGIIYSAGSFENDDIVLRNISTFVIEFGICLHSIIVGIVLGVCTESTFLAVLLAAIFHQFFSGFALGTRINGINTDTWFVPILMSFVFILSTPIGVAIGIGIRKIMNIQATLLSQAILNAVAAGVLLYSANSFLMGVEINHNPKFQNFNSFQKTVCLFSMYIGATIMCVLAIWV